MGIFGWSYPPGCNSVPGDEERGCEVCWGIDIDPSRSREGKRACICPECPECGSIGDPNCYKPVAEGGHGLVLSDEQKNQKAAEEVHQKKMDEDMAKWAEEESRSDEQYRKELAEAYGSPKTA